MSQTLPVVRARNVSHSGQQWRTTVIDLLLVMHMRATKREAATGRISHNQPDRTNQAISAQLCLVWDIAFPTILWKKSMFNIGHFFFSKEIRHINSLLAASNQLFLGGRVRKFDVKSSCGFSLLFESASDGTYSEQEPDTFKF